MVVELDVLSPGVVMVLEQIKVTLIKVTLKYVRNMVVELDVLSPGVILGLLYQRKDYASNTEGVDDVVVLNVQMVQKKVVCSALHMEEVDDVVVLNVQMVQEKAVSAVNMVHP